jgi:hypothetical protein
MTSDLTTLTTHKSSTHIHLCYQKAKARTTDKNENKNKNIYPSAPAEPIQGIFSGIGSSTLTAL